MSSKDTAGQAPPEAALQRLEQLAQEASRLLHQGRGDLARPLAAELLKALPNHAAVHHLVRQAAVIGFPWALSRETYVPGSRPPADPANVDLVAFHADLPMAPSGIHRKTDYMAVLALAFESAAMRAPKARRLLITDEKTEVPADLKVDEVLRYALDLERLMYERLRAQILYLESRGPDRSSVLMDSDIVVNADPTDIFAEDFDVGLTWRTEFPDAPFNGGMIFAGTGERAVEFFRRTRICYDAMAIDPQVAPCFPKDLRSWWGDQFALAATVGYVAFAQRQVQGVSVEGARVRFFPCEDYNFTIEPDRKYPADILRRKRFVHFKGNRKALQAQYVAAMRAGKL